MKALEQLVAGKTVALVGNAKSLQREEKGWEIDSHDVVVRINLGPTILKPHRTGSRTDVWATAKYFPTYSECQHMVFMKLTPLGNSHWGMFRTHYPDRSKERWTQELEDEVREFVGADPGTGIRLLYWLKRKSSAARVSIYGMDCWDTVSWPSGQMNTPNHVPDLERQAMARLLGNA